MHHIIKRIGLLIGLLLAINLIASCAHKTEAKALNTTAIVPEDAVWSGRISLQLQSEPPQAFFAGFELKGKADKGELTLISPLGNILGIMRWTPTQALLEQGGSIKSFVSTDELLAQTTGAAVPVAALFDWLAGKNTQTVGWTADLSQQPSGRINAKRIAPAPQADLRVVLDK